MRHIELNHLIEDGMAAYPGLPRPRVEAILDHTASRVRYQGKAEFYIGKIDMPFNTGTYMDAPFHRHHDKEDLAELPLARVAGLPGLVLDASPRVDRSVVPSCEADELRGKAVLLRTGWDGRWGTEAYWELGPFLGSAFLEVLIAAGAALVGVDFWQVDDPEDLTRPAHTKLLAAGIPIVEHLTGLFQLPREGFRFYAVPLRVVRGASFPVRAFAELP